MKFSYFEKGERKTKEVSGSFSKGYDVIVCGLGTAGAIALIKAAKMGLKVLGVENFNALGGTSTVGGVNGLYFGTEGGFNEEFIERYLSYNDKITSLSIESRKFVLDEMVRESGAEVMLDCSVCGIYHEKEKAIGVRCLNDDGFFDFSSSVVIDSTADGFIARMLGCEYEWGRESDLNTQPYTMVNLAKRIDNEKTHIKNVDFGRVDQRKNEEISNAYIFSRAYENVDIDKKKDRVILSAQLIGVREGARIVTEQTVTLKDVFEGKKTEKTVFYSYADLDKHGEDVAFDGEEFCDWNIGANLGAINVTVPVPYGALVPKGKDGILIACRALGVDRNISSCVRMIRDMFKIGEVAADGAYLAIKENCAVKDVDYEKLSAMLKETKCLDENVNYGYREDKVTVDGEKIPPKKVEFIKDKEKLVEALSSDRPGFAIWSAKLMGKECFDVLEKTLESENENLSKHSAFALALCGNKKCLEVLRKTAKERDGFILQDCRKHNRMRGWMAVYLLGRLRDKNSVDILCDILTQENIYKDYEYFIVRDKTRRTNLSGIELVYFQFVSLSLVALLKIGEEYKDTREKIKNAVEKAFESGFERKFTNQHELSSKYQMVSNMKNVAEKTINEWK